MKITILYGNRKNGVTHHCVELIKSTLSSLAKVDFSEIWLRNELPEMCCGCFNCILREENLCPHREQTKIIIQKIIEADGIILASPVYGMDVSGAMKNLIDHLCFMWMPHRPRTEMFSKIGFVLSSAAGMGTGRTNKTMKSSLNYWGVKRIHSYGSAVASSSWEGIKFSKKKKIEKALARKTGKFYKNIIFRKKLKVRFSTRCLFSMMRGMNSGFEDGQVDKEYWRSLGWLEKGKPF